MTSDGKPTIGFIGAAHPHSRGWLGTLRGMGDDVARVALCEADRELRQRSDVAERVAAFYDEPNALFDAEKPDLAMICLRHPEAVEVAISAAERGIHVFVEKPVAPTAADAVRIKEACAQAGVQFTTGYNWRHNPAARDVRKRVLEGELGDLWSVELRWITSTVRARDPKHWLFKKDVAGGGILHWLTCHFIDLARFLTGQEVKAVSAICRTVGGEAVDVEDVATVAMEFTGGAVGAIHAGYLRIDGSDAFIGLRGSRGEVHWSPLDDKTGYDYRVYGAGDQTPLWGHSAFTVPEREGYGGWISQELLRQFFRAMRGEREPEVTIDDAIAVLEIVEAAYASSERGAEVGVGA